MIDNLIRETALRLVNILSEQSESMKYVLTDPDNIETIEEAIEVLTDEMLRNFDDYIDTLESDESED